MGRFRFACYIAGSLVFCTSAHADFFQDFCGDVCRAADAVGQTLGDAAEKLVTEIANGHDAVTNEVVNGAKRIAKEVTNGSNDLRVLVETGRCGGDICTALDAMVVYSRATLQAQVASVQQAAQRLEEGKLVDAVWHLGVDPLNAQQEAAAQAAIRSSIIRAVGQAAATAYGGGAAGAAGYSAWLAYHETDGNLELALRAGAIAGATSAVMQSTGTLTDGTSIKDHLAIDQVARRAIISGAVAGAAVAASGGTQADVEKAAVAGIAMSVLRDGYTRLTAQDFDEESLKSSIGDGPCLADGPNGTRPCADEARASGALYKDDRGNNRTDYTKLSKRMPHVGAVSDGVTKAISQEDSGLMVSLSRFPGMNAMGHAHDAYIESLVGSFDDATLDLINKSTIPPFMIMTYTAAGFDVHDLIRQEIAARAEGRKPTVLPVVRTMPATEPVPSPGVSGSSGQSAVTSPPPVQYTTVPGLPLAAGEQLAAEIRQLGCVLDDDVRTTVLEIPLDATPTEDAMRRICSIDRFGPSGLLHLWHAHHQTSSCIAKFNEIALRNIRQGRECALSIGVRYGVEAVTSDAK